MAVNSTQAAAAHARSLQCPKVLPQSQPSPSLLCHAPTPAAALKLNAFSKSFLFIQLKTAEIWGLEAPFLNRKY